MNNLILNCPYCNAKYKEGIKCRRCKNDISFFINIANDAMSHYYKALKAEKENNYEKAFFHSKRSLALKVSKEALNIYAKSLAITGRFDDFVKKFS